MHVPKNAKSTNKWSTANSVRKHAEDVLKNAAK